MTAAALLLDIGNSAVKWLCVDASGGLRQGRASVDKVVEDLADDLVDATVLVASVAAPATHAAVAQALARTCKYVWFAQSRAALDGLVNSYQDPQRMGVDRWLAMLGARRRVEGRLCVVDAGSALTIDLVATNGQHEGGYIIPGSALMERALFADTGRVRDSSAQKASVAPGRSTAEAVSHGVLLAQAGAVRMAVSAAESHGECPRLLLCGGGAAQLSAVLGLKCEQLPTLVFEGLLRQAELETPELLNYSQVSSVLFAKSD